MKRVVINAIVGMSIAVHAHAGTLLDAPGDVSPDVMQNLMEDVPDLFSDPVAVQIRRLIPSADGKSICGQFNAKNRGGGYVGFQAFRYFPERRKVYAPVPSCT